MRYTPLLLACAALCCGHEAPLTPGDYAPGQPLTSGPVVRLTFNPGADLSPAWLPDGSGFFYTAERLDRPDRDRCLALMPAAGGSIVRQICNRAPPAEDSVDAFAAAAASPDGRLAYTRASADIGFGWPLSPRFRELVLASLSDPLGTTVLESFPVTAPDNQSFDEAGQVRWLDDQSLVYLGQTVRYLAGCAFCPPDTLSIGVEIARLDLAGPVPVLSVLPGTDSASSVTTVGNDTVYFTLYNDSRVHRLALGSGARDVAHDFGPGGGAVVRDVQVAGTRLVAVVGGSVQHGVDPVQGLVARDHGGDVHVVDLSSGADQPFVVPGVLFRHLALDPAGRIVIAQGSPITVNGPDTTFSALTDLWRLELP